LSSQVTILRARSLKSCSTSGRHSTGSFPEQAGAQFPAVDVFLDQGILLVLGHDVLDCALQPAPVVHQRQPEARRLVPGLHHQWKPQRAALLRAVPHHRVPGSWNAGVDQQRLRDHLVEGERVPEGARAAIGTPAISSMAGTWVYRHSPWIPYAMLNTMPVGCRCGAWRHEALQGGEQGRVPFADGDLMAIAPQGLRHRFHRLLAVDLRHA